MRTTTTRVITLPLPEYYADMGYCDGCETYGAPLEDHTCGEGMPPDGIHISVHPYDPSNPYNLGELPN